ncbi:MAG: tetraacyldisaccharide 4'-kinase [Legionella sp.]|nr:tetraacyldisaccharide 4'-kinase [Legionella sp.]
MQRSLEKLWYNHHPLRWGLWPFSKLYQGIVSLRRRFLIRFCQHQFAVPVIVVGNLTVGGVGKTPLVIGLVKAFQEKGLRVGVVSRGYGAAMKHFPHEITKADNAREVGDEPLLIFQKSGCPVVIAPKRVDAVRYLLEKFQSQIIISDDGLQHYAMGRAIEIVVIDGARGLGNGMCLPAGPLRETAHRLKRADFVVVNGGKWPDAFQMTLKPGQLTQVKSGKSMALSQLLMPVAAVAGIGHPERFFTTLATEGVSFNAYPFPDHHLYDAADFKFKEKSVVMTEKDAVKCQAFAADNWYFLPVEAKLDKAFWQVLWSHEQLKGYFK